MLEMGARYIYIRERVETNTRGEQKKLTSTDTKSKSNIDKKGFKKYFLGTAKEG